VVVPILLANRDLDWVQWADGAASGPLLGVDAIARCDAVLVPALAVAPDGTRLGRGGGSYDRALQRCGPRATVIALLFDGELVAELPSDPWDRPVSAVVTPGGFVPVGAPGNTGVGPGR
jgi:5-formyltetrahydrofolate cyclo-ligase